VLKILYLIHRLEPGGVARQLSLLAAALPRDRFEPLVCTLGRDGALAEPLRRAGVGVEALGWHRAFDPGPLWRLAARARDFRPDVVHTLGPLALRVAGLLPALKSYRRIVSAPFFPYEQKSVPGWLDRWLLRRSERIAVFSPREVETCRRSGVSESRLVRLTPAVARTTAEAAALDLPSGALCVACVGPLEEVKGFRDAIWSYDILRQVLDNVHVVLIGEGSDRPHLERFVHDTQTAELIHLLGPRDDIPALLASADLVWVPSRARGGVNAALEAQAAGRPVIATRLPELAEVIADGQTGVLIPVGDKVALARETRLLLEDRPRRVQMGEAARRHVAERFPVAELVRRCTDLYEGR
jgi:glycosyltransferase involved in cell wall biosynthesis